MSPLVKKPLRSGFPVLTRNQPALDVLAQHCPAQGGRREGGRFALGPAAGPWSTATGVPCAAPDCSGNGKWPLTVARPRQRKIVKSEVPCVLFSQSQILQVT